eukprot:gb/GEZN01009141.1/.p1 GENE.gb/GEZN01009141.1/~~gb/GEZN01009141.1/.p1  ORF type:complete len:422 (-),score=60.68 gb/GEZN01009141.1/:89-1249(-)
MGLVKVAAVSLLGVGGLQVLRGESHKKATVYTAGAAADGTTPQEQSLQSVLPYLRTGPPGLAQVIPPSDQPNSVFLYTDGVSVQPGEVGWVYGALLQEITDKTGKKRMAAVATGKPEDVIKGKLLPFSSKDKLAALASEEEQRGVVSVVREGGTVTKAYWLYKRGNEQTTSKATPGSWNPFKRSEKSAPSNSQSSSSQTEVIPQEEQQEGIPELPFLDQTMLKGKKLQCVYDLDKDGDAPLTFHAKVDFFGPLYVLGTTVGGQRFGFYTPLGFSSLDDFRTSNNHFLVAYEPQPTLLRPLTKTIYDFTSNGPQFGSAALLIGCDGGSRYAGSMRTAKSRLKPEFEVPPASKLNSLFGPDIFETEVAELWAYTEVVEKRPGFFSSFG